MGRILERVQRRAYDAAKQTAQADLPGRQIRSCAVAFRALMAPCKDLHPAMACKLEQDLLELLSF
jgi:hypothetical protein